ncbi:Uma2 family endonuclease [Aureimonas sp. AU22]|uniref:Uma2 family endonuclease n=1 Tax=Aureimonas sp. AU22 TaxID=1638162 RepID=UPI00078208BD|nr:Uma2 family endonuclease [Aureimonas sp. AU22]
MNIQLPPIRTADDFLRAFEGLDGKREFVRGKVIDMMVNVSRNHAKLTTALTVFLARTLDAERYEVGAADFGVRTPDGVRFPDVYVDQTGGGGQDLVAHAPVFVAEILSPSSMARDFGEKVRDYTALPSLLHYLVLSQDEPRVWLWARGEDGAFGSPEMVVGAEESVTLQGFGLCLPLADLYRGIA